MLNRDAILKVLRDEYGIRTEKELDTALAAMKKLNIGVFVATATKERTDNNGKQTRAS